MAECDIYCYGMIAHTFAFMTERFPVADEYTEISESWDYFGGETGTCAAVLSSLGVSVKIDGTHIGGRQESDFRKFFTERSVNINSVYFDEYFEGVTDYVIITDDKRTPLGSYGHFYDDARCKSEIHWNRPSEDDVKSCRAAAIDPVMDGELAAKYCIKHGKPYVTVDCLYDSFIHQNAAVTVVSGESLKSACPGKSHEELLPLYLADSKGLTIITNGGGRLIYGRGGRTNSFEPYKVKAVSTLGAGDTFKAGCAYGLLKGFSDDEIVRFASAAAAAAISRYPLHLNLPTLKEIGELQENFR